MVLGHRFNPRPAVKPGETPVPTGYARTHGGFNPRPAVKPGETPAGRIPGRHPRSFNPRPAVKPGETPFLFRYAAGLLVVSIRARRLSRARPTPTLAGGVIFLVSIRARRLSRARPRRNVRMLYASCFNPRPAVKPGETDLACGTCRYGNVSIRARRLSRARLPRIRVGVAAGYVSIRARRLSRARPNNTGRVQRARRSFNPRPAVKPGETAQHRCRWGWTRCFNPRPRG